MNANELYEEIKAALDYFDLRFKDMRVVTVHFHDGEIEFSYRGKSTRIKVEEGTKT